MCLCSLLVHIGVTSPNTGQHHFVSSKTQLLLLIKLIFVLECLQFECKVHEVSDMPDKNIIVYSNIEDMDIVIT